MCFLQSLWKMKRLTLISIEIAITLNCLLQPVVLTKKPHIYRFCPYLTETHHISATKPNRLMLFKETVAVYCENRTEHTNTLCGQNADFPLILKLASVF
jgi:hypothetical protein